jgi:hypothetical protein
MRAILFLRRRRHATIVITFILMHICLGMCCISSANSNVLEEPKAASGNDGEKRDVFG